MDYQQNPYQQQYPQQSHQQPPTDPSRGLQVGALVCGILSIVLFWFPFAGLPAAIVGVVLGVMGKKKAAMLGFRSGIATAGMICSIVGTAVNVLCIVCWIQVAKDVWSVVSACSSCVTCLNEMNLD
jgi:hypothetical protein